MCFRLSLTAWLPLLSSLLYLPRHLGFESYPTACKRTLKLLLQKDFPSSGAPSFYTKSLCFLSNILKERSTQSAYWSSPPSHPSTFSLQFSHQCPDPTGKATLASQSPVPACLNSSLSTRPFPLVPCPDSWPPLSPLVLLSVVCSQESPSLSLFLLLLTKS